MISIKSGVDVRGLNAVLWDAIYEIEKLYNNAGTDLVITSALDGNHSYGSLHYSGMALDFVTRTLKQEKKKK